MQTLYSPSQTTQSRDVFYRLFDGHFSDEERGNAAEFLASQLDNAAQLSCDLPDDVSDLEAWMENGVASVGHQYKTYLQARKDGSERQYFKNKSHALYFLRTVAPTKMVDGAWLYGLLSRWHDTRFLSLIQTYVEELGEGLSTKNHVVLFKKLLASQGIKRWDDLREEHYIQGAIQLALAYNIDRFLPEVIGFNLGYEQLPLHLLISAYELKELGIDPYYFTLHITVDNADSGHAKKAVDAIAESLPRLGDADDWYRRVRSGYMLNELGSSTRGVIDEFDLDAEMANIFARKGLVGQYAHSDYREVNGRSVNDWLSEPSQSGVLIGEMEKAGWFKRGENPQSSRFWKLIEGEKAKMFGVFSAYEQQVIYDWIADGWCDINKSKPLLTPEAKRLLTQHVEGDDQESASDFDAEARELRAQIAGATDIDETMKKITALMSPALHHSAPGLMATRIFNALML